MRILVTGGAGFIGSDFVRRSLKRPGGHEVTVLDKLTYAANPKSLEGLPADRFRLIEGDVADEALVDRLVGESDLVVHFAAESHVDRSLKDPAGFAVTNVLGTIRIAAAAARHGVRLHHVSTDEVFGDLPLDSVDEFTPETPYRPSSPYAASKASSDHFVRALVRSAGLQATISNCSNNFGPRQHPEKLIPRQIIRLLHGKPPAVYGEGANVRDWIHVADHNEAVWRIVEAGRPGETYLIGARARRSNLEIARALCRIAGRDLGDIVFVADRPGHDRRYAIDPSSTEALGWRPESGDLEDALAETFAWYRDNEDWWRESYLESEEAYRAQG